MAQKRSNGIYYIDTVVEGVRIAQSLKTTNKAEAEKRERKILDKLVSDALLRKAGIDPEPTQLGVAPRLKEFYDNDFLTWAEDEYKHRQRTLNDLKERFGLIAQFDEVANARLDNINEALLDRAKARMVSRNLAGRTINNAFGALRRVLRTAYRWSRDKGYKVYLPTEFPHAEVKDHERVVTTEEEQLYSNACVERKLPSDHRVFFKMLINTGMEPGYAVASRWEHVHFEGDEDRPNGWIHDPCKKTKKRTRDIPLTADLKTVLLAWWLEKGRPAEGWMFPSSDKENESHRPIHSFYSTHKRIFGKSLSKTRGKLTKRKSMPFRQTYGLQYKEGKKKGLDVPYFRLYDLRHTFLTRLGDHGVSEVELMKIAGWSSTQMAANYVHPSKRRIADVVSRLDRPQAASAGTL
jgi:integrase